MMMFDSCILPIDTVCWCLDYSFTLFQLAGDVSIMKRHLQKSQSLDFSDNFGAENTARIQNFVSCHCRELCQNAVNSQDGQSCGKIYPNFTSCTSQKSADV
ncbi:hypothetical protein ACROYT_G001063 [Oculina patagonica]